MKLIQDAAYVASIEGDAPLGGFYPPLRDLIIRPAAGDAIAGGGAAEIRVALPCGRVPQCWPGSMAWAPDGRPLSFALRTPGSHAYSQYSVADAGISNWLSYYGENGIDGWMIPYFGASACDDPEVYARSSAIR